MKINLATLRKIIKEEVSRALNEAVSIEQLKSKPVCSSWFKQMMKAGPAAINFAAAWDDMVESAKAGVTSIRSAADDIASTHDIDSLAVSFHLRQLLQDPDVKTGVCPSGDDFLAAVESRMSASRPPAPISSSTEPNDPYAYSNMMGYPPRD